MLSLEDGRCSVCLTHRLSEVFAKCSFWKDFWIFSGWVWVKLASTQKDIICNMTCLSFHKRCFDFFALACAEIKILKKWPTSLGFLFLFFWHHIEGNICHMSWQKFSLEVFTQISEAPLSRSLWSGMAIARAIIYYGWHTVLEKKIWLRQRLKLNSLPTYLGCLRWLQTTKKGKIITDKCLDLPVTVLSYSTVWVSLERSFPSFCRSWV